MLGVLDGNNVAFYTLNIQRVSPQEKAHHIWCGSLSVRFSC